MAKPVRQATVSLGVPLRGWEGVCDLVLTPGIAADGGANQEGGDPRGARRVFSHSRCRADMALQRQTRPDSGLGFQEKVFNIVYAVHHQKDHTT